MLAVYQSMCMYTICYVILQIYEYLLLGRAINDTFNFLLIGNI